MYSHAAFSFRIDTHPRSTGFASDLFSLPKVRLNRFNISNCLGLSKLLWIFSVFMFVYLLVFSYPY